MDGDRFLESLRAPFRREQSGNLAASRVNRSAFDSHTRSFSLCLRLAIALSSGMLVLEYYGAWYANSISLSIIALQSFRQIILFTAALIDHRRSNHIGGRLSSFRMGALIEFGASIVLLVASVPMSYQALFSLWVPAESDVIKPMCILYVGICINILIVVLMMRSRSATASRSMSALGSESEETDLAATRRVGLSHTLVRAILRNQLTDMQLSTAMLFAMALSDLCGWACIDALGGIAGAFILSVSASKSLIKAAEVLVDPMLPSAS